MKKVFVFMAALAAGIGAFAQPKLTADNIDEIVAAMTLEEKAELCTGQGWGSMMAGSLSASSTLLVPGAAGTTHAYPHLGIPSTVYSDGPAGLRISPTRPGTDKTYYCTGFPVGSAYTSSWDVELVENMTKAMGNEVLEYGADILLGPGMNIHRNPLCGRNFEYYSEDPVLTGKIAAAYVKGIQSNGVGTSVKHFAVNSQETNRFENDDQLSIRALREIYLKGFEIVVKEAQPWTVMSSYNKINGTYAQQSVDLLTNILREEWGYDGLVVTDWGSKLETPEAVHGGSDLMMPGMEVETQRIIDAVKNGTLSEEDLDRNVKHILGVIVRTPHYKGYKYSDNPDLEAHAQVARTAAAESMVLLKNEGNALPLAGVNKIALFGATSVDFVAGGTGSGNVNKAYVVNLIEGLENAGYELSAGLKEYYQKYNDFYRANEALNGAGVGQSVLFGATKVPEPALSRKFVDAEIAKADIAVVVLGRNAGEGADRVLDNDFNISEAERQLLNDVCNSAHLVGKKVVVVLNIGGVIETASWKSLPDAILLAWQPGQEGGNAIADVLSGKVNPSGKLVSTFPINYLDHPSSKNFPVGVNGPEKGMFSSIFGGPQMSIKDYDYTSYEEDIWVGYRHFTTREVEVSYPFGYGLSYTTFEYSKPIVKANSNGGFTATVVVKNTGSVAGKEVVQLYVSAPAGGLEKPARELKAFGKTRLLAPGESQLLSFEVSSYELASFNDDSNKWETAPGAYTIYLSKNVQDTACSASVSLKGKSFSVTNAFVK